MAAIMSYRHSGKLGPAAIPYALGAGLVAAGALAWIYQAVLDWIPFIYLNILATAGYGIAIGAAAGFAFRAGRGRNVPVAIAIAIVSCLAGDALSFHFAYERALAKAAEELGPEAAENAEVRQAMREAVPFRDYIDARVEDGVTVGRSGGGLRLTGILMWLVWIAEAGILGVVAAGAQIFLLGMPFCEACDRFTEKRALGSIASVKPSALAAARGKGDVAVLLDPPQEEHGRKHATYTLHACPTCDNRYLTLALEWTERGKKGKDEKKTEAVVQNAIVTPEQVEALQARLRGRPPAPEGPATGTPAAR
ncbi:MAG TPA: hypothetical protein VFY93_07815 [Planctomycetota bacterium]|nr:hypothetical protein [Planctomycetota bacterium]